MGKYDEEVKAILKPFANLNDKRNQNYDTIMRGVVGCRPELRNNLELFYAVSDEVQRICGKENSRTYATHLITVGTAKKK